MKNVMILLIALSFSFNVHARCPADDMGCTKDNYQEKIKNRIDKGKKDVKKAKGVSKKVKAVKDTVRDCTDCATKVLTDGISGADVTK